VEKLDRILGKKKQVIYIPQESFSQAHAINPLSGSTLPLTSKTCHFYKGLSHSLSQQNNTMNKTTPLS
jgi:hypothetical protein